MEGLKWQGLGRPDRPAVLDTALPDRGMPAIMSIEVARCLPHPVKGRIRVWSRQTTPVAVCTGRFARRALMAGYGSVLASFPSALYLESAAGVACLLPPPAPCGPLNVVLRDFKPGTPVRSGAAWRADGTTLAIDGLGTFPIPVRDEWSPPRPPSVRPATLLAGLASMRAALAARAPRGEVLGHVFRPLPERPAAPATQAPRTTSQAPRTASQVPRTASRPGPIDAHFARAVPTLSRWLDDALAGGHASTAGHASTPAPVTGLLGAGRGLTPSGDDCIVGVLVALHALGERGVAASIARTVARHAPSRTSRLSAAHLGAACAGEAIEPVHAAIGAVAGNASPAPVLDALEKYGHDSGFDALAGVLVAADAIAHHRASASTSAAARHMNAIGGDGFRIVRAPGAEPIAIDAPRQGP